MIFDKLENLSSYYSIDSSLEEAGKFLQDFVDNPKPTGRYDIEGDRVFAIVSQYKTKPAEGKLCEAHRKYIDLQFMLKGREYIGWAPVDELYMETEEFSKGGDIAYYSGNCKTWLPLKEGYFVLLFPQDAHLPCIKSSISQQYNIKIVVKIAVK